MYQFIFPVLVVPGLSVSSYLFCAIYRSLYIHHSPQIRSSELFLLFHVSKANRTIRDRDSFLLCPGKWSRYFQRLREHLFLLKNFFRLFAI